MPPKSCILHKIQTHTSVFSNHSTERRRVQEEILWASWQGLFRRQADVPLGQLDQRIGVFIHQFYGQTGGIGGRQDRQHAGGQAGVPVVPIDAAGFYGSKKLGDRIAGETMFNYVIGTREPDPIPESAQRPGIKVHDIALIAEYNICGEFWHVAPLFDELGLRLLGSLSGDARFREVQTMHRAEASMIV